MSTPKHEIEEKVELLWQRVQATGMSRRDFIALLAAGGTAAVLAACGAEEATPTAAVPVAQPTQAPATEAAPTAGPTAEATASDGDTAEAEPRLHIKPLPEAFFIVHGSSVEMRWDRVPQDSYVIDSGLFFIRNHAESPMLDAGDWRLRVTGNAIQNELELTYDDLLAMPARTVTRFVECAGNGRSFFDTFMGQPAEGSPWTTGGMGVATWTGVPLSEILNRAGVLDSAVSVLGTGLDSVAVSKPMPIDKALAEDTLVVYGMNGGPLPYDHGFPARLLVPGWAGSFNVKWLGSLEVGDQEFYTKWNTTSYVLIGPDYADPEGEPEGEAFQFQTVKSNVALPWPATLAAGEQTIWGFAWSPFGEIQMVEVSLDGGQTWEPAELEGPNVAAAGSRWQHTVNLEPGEMTITTRATDTEGNSQWPVEEQKWNQLGYIWGAVIAHPVTVGA